MLIPRHALFPFVTLALVRGGVWRVLCINLENERMDVDLRHALFPYVVRDVVWRALCINPEDELAVHIDVDLKARMSLPCTLICTHLESGTCDVLFD